MLPRFRAIDLRGRALAITGASSGIGAATAIAASRAGMPVALAARRLDKLEAVVAKIRASGGHAIAVACDVTDASACEAFVAQAERELGGLYGVFANAGYGQEAPVLAMPDGELRAMFETNLFGSLAVIRPAVAAIRRRSREGLRRGEPIGHVLWCSSCLALLPTPMHGVYSASKAAQHHLSRAMRTELAGEGIEVSSVHPIGTRTEFFDTAAETTLRSGAGVKPRLIDRADSAFMQDASVVAARVVACLRRPRAEVWTGLPALALRTAMAGAAWMPNVADPLIGRLVRARLARKG
ncbi:MAG: SDR family NAD(P)-dependent oxidoreductase [Phycisphaerales bacterium]|jgi:short-subunit dehydrogenase|nr:SDR family NAD(P)-dependent oxidoreductase [Phycisphaerales bacterium]